MALFGRNKDKGNSEGKGLAQAFTDGIQSFTNSLANTRKASAVNTIYNYKVSDGELREIFRMGVASRIYRIKAGYALNNTLEFETKEDEDFYNTHLKRVVKRAALYQLGFGRGIIAIMPRNGDLTLPQRGPASIDNVVMRAFAGDRVGSIATQFDIRSERYYKPDMYSVREATIHWTRTVDFTYYEPTEDDLPRYDYGGVSEAELLYEQIINDGVMERATSSIVERNSTLIYKVKGFKEKLAAKQERGLLEYFKRMEDARSIYGAGIVDQEDEVESVAQALTNLAEANDSSLRRLAMVSGIPLPMLVGENVKGLNSSGDTERQTFEDTIGSYADDYLIDNINTLMGRFGRGKVKFKGLKTNSATEQANYDKIVIGNAVQLATLGGDFETYLESHDVVPATDIDDFMTGESFFMGEDVPEAEVVPSRLTEEGQATAPEEGENVTPESTGDVQDLALNGAQVTSLLEVVKSVAMGELPKATAQAIIALAYPVSANEATLLLSDVVEGSTSGTGNGEEANNNQGSEIPQGNTEAAGESIIPDDSGTGQGVQEGDAGQADRQDGGEV